MSDLNEDVELFIPMNNVSPLQLISDEISKELQGNELDQDIQPTRTDPSSRDTLGFVQLIEPLRDLVFIERCSFAAKVTKQNAEAILESRLKFFLQAIAVRLYRFLSNGLIFSQLCS